MGNLLFNRLNRGYLDLGRKMTETEEKPKYSGYGYHGGGRKKLSESGRKNLALSLQQNQIDSIKRLAQTEGMTNSGFIMRCVDFWKENH